MIFLSFIAGVILASAVCYIVFSKKNLALKEEIITLSAKSKSTELSNVILFSLQTKR